MDEPTCQLKGGTFSSTEAAIISSKASKKKRFQLIDTNQRP
jgi:hypothetical protein